VAGAGQVLLREWLVLVLFFGKEDDAAMPSLS